MHGVSGSCRPRDLETALQLVHLHLHAPDREPSRAGDAETEVPGVPARPREQSGGRVRGLRHRRQHARLLHGPPAHPRRDRHPGAGASLAFYRERFANAADFRFFFVGSFQVDSIARLIARYLDRCRRAAPARRASSTACPASRTAGAPRVWSGGSEPKSSTWITFFADTGLDELEMHRARAAASILEERLRVIRARAARRHLRRLGRLLRLPARQGLRHDDGRLRQRAREHRPHDQRDARGDRAAQVQRTECGDVARTRRSSVASSRPPASETAAGSAGCAPTPCSGGTCPHQRAP